MGINIFEFLSNILAEFVELNAHLIYKGMGLIFLNFQVFGSKYLSLFETKCLTKHLYRDLCDRCGCFLNYLDDIEDIQGENIKICRKKFANNFISRRNFYNRMGSKK